MFTKTSGAVAALIVALSLAKVLSGQQRPHFEPPQVIAAEEPVYPLNVVNTGTVVLEVMLDPEGKIEAVKVVQGAPGFTQEAQRAIQRWKFRPARLDGKPIRSVIPVAFSFSRPPIWWPRKTP